MSVRSLVDARVDRSRLVLGLGIGDLLAVGGFVVAGEIRHGIDPLVAPGYVGETLALFLLGWATAALLGGLYTRDAVKSPRRVLSWTLPAWIMATLLVHAVMALVGFHGGTGLTFVAVTLGIGGVLVVGWRLVVSLVLDLE
ncbi:MAG: DUF3054 domain-containing protein [Haloarculaceae archaeon]